MVTENESTRRPRKYIGQHVTQYRILRYTSIPLTIGIIIMPVCHVIRASRGRLRPFHTRHQSQNHAAAPTYVLPSKSYRYVLRTCGSSNTAVVGCWCNKATAAGRAVVSVVGNTQSRQVQVPKFYIEQCKRRSDGMPANSNACLLRGGWAQRAREASTLSLRYKDYPGLGS